MVENTTITDEEVQTPALEAEDAKITDGDLGEESSTEWWSFSNQVGVMYHDVVYREISGDNDPHGLTRIGRADLIIVGGSQQADSGNSFCDIISTAGVINFDVFETRERDSPGPRTYSRENRTLEVAIDDPDELYDVHSRSLGGED